MPAHKISSTHIDFNCIKNILSGNLSLELSESAKEKIIACRTYLDNRMQSQKDPIYGINTGFGALYNKTISNEDLDTLQTNLVLSHACGTGEEVPAAI
ncbi:MAG: aromatic amino acid ammonia-lyase, partial [Bacteroidota bacterium]|nr:aromatic amino acid ammonia-lyase [Bacteroidota bacterium]